MHRGVIGVHAQTVTPTLAAGLGLERSRGVVLGDVRPGGPADRAWCHRLAAESIHQFLLETMIPQH